MTRQQKFDALVRDYRVAQAEGSDDWASRERLYAAGRNLAAFALQNADRITVRSGR